MEVTDIASLATQLSQTRLQQQVGVAVLKKALDAEASTALALLRALPPVQSIVNLPGHLGQNINTTA
jgi:hypothetical protein